MDNKRMICLRTIWSLIYIYLKRANSTKKISLSTLNLYGHEVPPSITSNYNDGFRTLTLKQVPGDML